MNLNCRKWKEFLDKLKYPKEQSGYRADREIHRTAGCV